MATTDSRTERIVDRVRQELELHRRTDVCSDLTSARIVNESLMLVRSQAESLHRQASLVAVTQQILLITAHALGRMGVEAGVVYSLNGFCAEIDTLVLSLGTGATERAQ